jgi:hypothetical protein
VKATGRAAALDAFADSNLVLTEPRLVLAVDQAKERVDRSAGSHERIVAEVRSRVVVEDECSNALQELPRESCVDDHVETEVGSTDIDEVEACVLVD